MSEELAPQSKTTMLIICFFIGFLGIHRKMMGHGNWWMMILANLVCLGGLWALIDLIMIATGKLKMADGRDLT